MQSKTTSRYPLNKIHIANNRDIERERERGRETDRQTENEIEKSHKKVSNKSDRMRISKLIKRQHKKELRNNEKIN